MVRHLVWRAIVEIVSLDGNLRDGLIYENGAVIVLMKIVNSDIRRAFNILNLATIKQLREVEKVMKFELERVEGVDAKKDIQRTLNMLYLVDCLINKFE